jgi:hypothetical protein
MAKLKPAPAVPEGRQVMKWDEQLAAEAAKIAESERNTGTGQWISAKGGILSFNDEPMPDNEMAVVILDSIFENVYYPNPYNPNVREAPVCWAFDHDYENIAPLDSVPDKQSDECETCEQNVWGSMGKKVPGSRGKACSNVRRLAMIPAGELLEDNEFKPLSVDDMEKAGIAFFKLPVTSVKFYAAYVKRLASALSRPPWGVVTKMSVVPDQKNSFHVEFSPLGKLGEDTGTIIMARRKEALGIIEMPYQTNFDDDEEPAVAPARRAAPARPAPRQAVRPIPASTTPVRRTAARSKY